MEFIMKINCIAQPTARTTCQAIDGILQNRDIERMDVAVAYITSSGIDVLLKTMDERSYSQNRGVVKRWITSFDYCRTDPIALQALLDLPSSSVRIHDAQNCLMSRGVPKVPYHPKSYMFHSPKKHYLIAGSGNLSRSGLCRGYEAGLVIEIDRGPRAGKISACEAVAGLQNWFNQTWDAATTLSNSLLNQYNALYESTERLKSPVPTEDDIATSDIANGSITNEDLRKLRICRHFWIEAGNITKNRGRELPGNQLMMKRFSRVFFGFEPLALPENSLIGEVMIGYRQSRANYHLTYSDNNMDKLVLPIPGDAGPDSYDNKSLLFERTSPGQFRLSVEAPSVGLGWVRKSKLLDAAFKMKSGRGWGVF
jgi:HKD family nuclease